MVGGSIELVSFLNNSGLSLVDFFEQSLSLLICDLKIVQEFDARKSQFGGGVVFS